MKAKSFIYCTGLTLTLAFTPAASRAETGGGAGGAPALADLY